MPAFGNRLIYRYDLSRCFVCAGGNCSRFRLGRATWASRLRASPAP